MTGIREKDSDSLEGQSINCRGCKSLKKILLLKGWGGSSSISDTAETTENKSLHFVFCNYIAAKQHAIHILQKRFKYIQGKVRPTLQPLKTSREKIFNMLFI